jgi:D-tyrosyl-tRNA(Tyr) deacylase
MRAVVQRVLKSQVEAEGHVTGAIARGLVVFLGVRKGDGDADIRYMAEKILDLRIFPGDSHPMNRSLRDLGGELLLVSQFTLYGDCRHGRRPSFDEAEAPGRASEVYRRFAEHLRDAGFPPREGIFGADMQVHIQNDGPVTIILDSQKVL